MLPSRQRDARGRLIGKLKNQFVRSTHCSQCLLVIQRKDLILLIESAGQCRCTVTWISQYLDYTHSVAVIPASSLSLSSSGPEPSSSSSSSLESGTIA